MAKKTSSWNTNLEKILINKINKVKKAIRKKIIFFTHYNNLKVILKYEAKNHLIKRVFKKVKTELKKYKK